VARCVRHVRVSSDFENRLLSRRLARPDSSPSASGGAAAPFEDSLAAPHHLRIAAEHSDLLACGVDEFAAGEYQASNGDLAGEARNPEVVEPHRLSWLRFRQP